ncbi:tail fiber domain-containing protein [Asaia sp. HN010]|uniref:tail fiber domain-containing protein n=1 Tax=Asaia sp. HN010 TaxID=3081233 RepID=UPI00301AC44B
MSESIGTPVFKTVKATDEQGFQGDGSALKATSKANGTATLSEVLDAAITGRKTAAAAKDAIKNALDGTVRSEQIGKPSGVVGLDGSGNAALPGGLGIGGNYLNIGTNPGSSVALKIGSPGASNQWQRVQFYSGSATSPATWSDVTMTVMGGTGSDDGSILIGTAAINPGGDNKTSLGSASSRYAGIYLASSPNVTSDAGDKTILGKIGDPEFAEGLALSRLWDMLTPKVYTLREDGRHHVGLIAQDVQRVLTEAGLDPATIGMWGQDDLTQIVDVIGPITDEETGEVTQGVTGQKIAPLTKADGTPVTRQSLRYDELCVAIFAGAKIAMEKLSARVADLEKKNGSAAS